MKISYIYFSGIDASVVGDACYVVDAGFELHIQYWIGGIYITIVFGMCMQVFECHGYVLDFW